jgi:DNA repair protein RadD
MHMHQLYPYQQKAVDALRHEYRSGARSVLFVLPTGGGKTVVFSHIAEHARGKVLVLVHRVELLEQASRSLARFGVPHGTIRSRQDLDLSERVQVASVQTIARRLARIPADWFSLVIVDEAHHSNAGTWAQVLGHFSSAQVLGVTATPVRTDGRGLGEHYERMVLGPLPAWLTDNDYLAAARVFAPPIGFDVRQLRVRAGDYAMDDAAAQLTQRAAMGDVVQHYRRYLDGQTAIAFCCSVAHAEAVAARFAGEGISASSIDGTMSTDQRRELLQQLGAGDLKVLTSCQLIGEGVDVPSVGGCILLRPTQSEALHLQMIGRCLRPQAGKVAVVLDHVGNVQRLGHHLEEREWTLDGVRKRAKDAAAPAVRICSTCFAAMPATAQACPECGAVRKITQAELKIIDGELEEIRQVLQKGHKVELWCENQNEWEPYSYTFIGYVGPNKNGDELVEVADSVRKYTCLLKHVRRSPNGFRRQQGTAQTLEQLIEVGRRRGMKNPHGWARHVLAARQAKQHHPTAS